MSKKKSKINPSGKVGSRNQGAPHLGGTPDPQEVNWMVGLFDQGRYDEAKMVAEAMTARFPRFGFGWKVLAVMLCQLGRNADAIAPMRKAAVLEPRDPEVHFNLGNVLKDLGQLTEAVASYRRALVIDPNYAEAHGNLGAALQALGRLDEAVASYRRALTLMPESAGAHFNLGNVLQDFGQFDAAVVCYRNALAREPNFAEAHFNLGVALQGLGHYDEAVESYGRALTIDPGSHEAHFNLGNALKDIGQLDEAVTSYLRALEIKPDYEAADWCLGNALRDLGRPDDAVASYRKALAIRPDSADAHNNMGNAWKDLGRTDDAVASFRRALEIQPDLVEAHYNLGAALKSQGQADEAVKCYERALAIRPGYAEAHNNLGNALKDMGRLDDAAASYLRALAIKPDYAEAECNLGGVHHDLGRVDDALACYHRALMIKPDLAEAHYNLGAALHGLGRRDEAAASYRRALIFKPDYAEAHNNLGVALHGLGRFEEGVASSRRALAIDSDYAVAHNNLGICLQEIGRLDDALASYYRALTIKPDYAEARSNLLFALAYHALVPSPKVLEEALSWQTQVIPKSGSETARRRKFHPQPRVGRRLRIGYVSGDFRQHPVSYFLEPLFKSHDRERVELFAYSTLRLRDEVTERLETLADHWRTIASLSNDAAREQIEADAIDVLVDLSGHTEHNRLGVFALRSAPVQAHYLGYFATTGLTEMDYWLGDSVILPESENDHYSETIWRLPRVWVSYQGQEDAPLPRWGPREDGTVWFGSFNNLKKITPATLALWAKLLHALPEARLLLKTKGLADPVNRQRIAGELNALGIGAERFELIGESDGWLAHMAQYDRLDIALDPIGGVGGGTTTCDALWMGVPVVTLTASQMTQRMTSSMLDAIGHREWVTETEDDYVTTAMVLANDVEQRRSLRVSQRDKMRNSPLCDAAGLAQSLEDAYETMFDIWWQKNTDEGPDEVRAVNGGNQPC